MASEIAQHARYGQAHGGHIGDEQQADQLILGNISTFEPKAPAGAETPDAPADAGSAAVPEESNE